MNDDNKDTNNSQNPLKKENLILKDLPKSSDSKKEGINHNICDQLDRSENLNKKPIINNSNDITLLSKNNYDFNPKNVNVSNNLQLFLNNWNVNVTPYNSFDNYLKSMNLNLLENLALNMCYNNMFNNLGTSIIHNNMINTHQQSYHNIINPNNNLQNLMYLNDLNSLHNTNNFNHSIMNTNHNNNLFSSNQLELHKKSLLNNNNNSNNNYRNFQGHINPLFNNTSSDNKLGGVNYRDNINNQNVLNSQSYPTSKDNLIDVLKSYNFY